MTPPVIEVERVTRRFGAVVALDEVSLAVRPGELVGFLGPNGAGKTTLLSLVNGLRRPDSGRVRLFGGDPRTPASRIRLGSTPQETGLPANLRVREVVDFVCGHYPHPRPAGELLEQFGLSAMARRQCGGLSGGEKRRLAVALALAGDPSLVLLDEPTTGLDVDGRHLLWDALRAYHATGNTIVLTSHYLEEVQALAERVVIMDHGRMLADDALAGVLGRVAVRRVGLTVPDGVDLAGLRDLPGVVDVRAVDDADRGGEGGAGRGGEGGAGHKGAGGAGAGGAGGAGRGSLAANGVVGSDAGDRRVELLSGDADALVRALVRADIGFRDLEVRSASLEEAFLTLTGRDVAT